jgi:hypothetical protein
MSPARPADSSPTIGRPLLVFLPHRGSISWGIAGACGGPGNLYSDVRFRLAY